MRNKKVKRPAWNSLTIMLHDVKRVTVSRLRNPETVRIAIDKGDGSQEGIIFLFGTDVEIRVPKKVSESPAAPSQEEPSA